MPYKKSFYLEGNNGNNSFGYKYNKDLKLHIPKLIEGSLDDLKIGKKIAFREVVKGKLKEFVGLRDFVKIRYNIDAEINSAGPSIYIFDNHNHALYFWYKEYLESAFEKGISLLHIDQHTDMNDGQELKIDDGVKNKEEALGKILEFTNYHCNVGNFILPAVTSGLIGDVIQVNTEGKLLDTVKHETTPHILDIDLDLRDPKMGIEDIEKTFQICKDLISKASLVTIATSPYFMDQKKAIEIVKRLLK